MTEIPARISLRVPAEDRRADARTASRRPMLDVVLRHAPDFDSASMEMRASREGNYLSLTCTLNATSREQLDDAVPRAVRASDGDMVL